LVVIRIQKADRLGLANTIPTKGGHGGPPLQYVHSAKDSL
jgi:hypothetical protein